MKKMTLYVEDNFGWENKVNLLSIITGISKNNVAKAVGTVPGSFLGRCRNGKFTLNEMRIIAQTYGGKYLIRFITDDGKVFDSDDCDNIKNFVEKVKEYKELTWAEIAAKTNSYYDKFIQRLNVGKLTDDNICEIAKALDCTYESYIELENGSII